MHTITHTVTWLNGALSTYLIETISVAIFHLASAEHSAPVDVSYAVYAKPLIEPIVALTKSINNL
ncbi:hypothetical protein [Serratia microhaemolytica]|uniref:hypothetical protein n=1 Tax=Serratia microhaemolytica TaxID=2675110 RepID=UPI000FDDEC67|nr:hypothetical protein [Serratia microhaemolytica]